MTDLVGKEHASETLKMWHNASERQTMQTTDKTPNLPRDSDNKLLSWAWPGGYPIYYITADCGVLCPDCARQAESDGLTTDPDDSQWYLTAADANYENTSLYCDNCSKQIETAY